MPAENAMLLYIREEQTGKWTKCTGVFSGLQHAAASHGALVGIYSNDPEAAMQEITGTMKRAAECGIAQEAVCLITPHPTLDALHHLADWKQARLLVAFLPARTDADPAQAIAVGELCESVCPLLHCTRGNNVVLSVCGAHNDRMVLAEHHMQAWCLTGHAQCPHYRMKCHEL
jgi:hypothetical protein